MFYNHFMTEKWNRFVTQKYIEFRGDKVGREGSIVAFARWIGIPQSQMSRMLSKDGQIPTSHKTINAFVKKYGTDVFEALDMPIPLEEDFTASIEPNTRDEALAIIRELADRFGIPVEIHDDRDQKRKPK